MNRKFPLIFAHRGFRAAAPENTLAAFEVALKLPIDGVEFDVQMTRDHKLVVIHDETLDRTTSGFGYIKDHTYEEIEKYDAGSWFSKEFAGQKVPLLDEVLALLSKYNVFVNIELKTGFVPYKGIEELTVKLVDKYGMKDRVGISSFNPVSIKNVKSINSSYKTALLEEVVLNNSIDFVKELKAEAFHVNYKNIDALDVERFHKAGILVRCYTVNNEVDMEKLVFGRVDGVFTDKPDVMIEMKQR